MPAGQPSERSRSRDRAPDAEPIPPPTWSPAARRRARLLGLARCLGCLVAMLAFGLGWAALVEPIGSPPGSAPATYPGAPMPDPAAPSAPTPPAADPEPALWLVDGFNVLHAGILRGRERAGWWRAEMQARVVRQAAELEPRDVEVWVVFDAARPDSERCQAPAEPTRVRVVHTPSADDWLVRRVRSDPEPGRLAVVTGDRQVVDRCRHAGGRVVAPRVFLTRCGLDLPPSRGRRART